MGVWYWQKHGDDQPRGPVEEKTLKDMARNGDIGYKDKVWTEGFSDWILATQLEFLFRNPPPLNHDQSASQKSDSSNESDPWHDFVSRVKENPGTGTQPNINSTEADQTGKQKLKGVRGWLLFFCISLTILSPITNFGSMSSEWEAAQTAFDAFPSLEGPVLLESFMRVVIVLYGVLVGIMIWSGNKNGNLIAEKYLKIRLGAIVIVELMVLGMLSDLPAEIMDMFYQEFFGAIIQELLFFLVWFSYFKKSKRVKNTFQNL